MGGNGIIRKDKSRKVRRPRRRRKCSMAKRIGNLISRETSTHGKRKRVLKIILLQCERGDEPVFLNQQAANECRPEVIHQNPSRNLIVKRRRCKVGRRLCRRVNKIDLTTMKSKKRVSNSITRPSRSSTRSSVGPSSIAPVKSSLLSLSKSSSVCSLTTSSRSRDSSRSPTRPSFKSQLPISMMSSLLAQTLCSPKTPSLRSPGQPCVRRPPDGLFRYIRSTRKKPTKKQHDPSISCKCGCYLHCPPSAGKNELEALAPTAKDQSSTPDSASRLSKHLVEMTAQKSPFVDTMIQNDPAVNTSIQDDPPVDTYCECKHAENVTPTSAAEVLVTDSQVKVEEPNGERLSPELKPERPCKSPLSSKPSCNVSAKPTTLHDTPNSVNIQWNQCSSEREGDPQSALGKAASTCRRDVGSQTHLSARTTKNPRARQSSLSKRSSYEDEKRRSHPSGRGKTVMLEARRSSFHREIRICRSTRGRSPHRQRKAFLQCSGTLGGECPEEAVELTERIKKKSLGISDEGTRSRRKLVDPESVDATARSHTFPMQSCEIGSRLASKALEVAFRTGTRPRKTREKKRSSDRKSLHRTFIVSKGPDQCRDVGNSFGSIKGSALRKNTKPIQNCGFRQTSISASEDSECSWSEDKLKLSGGGGAECLMKYTGKQSCINYGGDIDDLSSKELLQIEDLTRKGFASMNEHRKGKEEAAMLMSKNNSEISKTPICKDTNVRSQLSGAQLSTLTRSMKDKEFLSRTVNSMAKEGVKIIPQISGRIMKPRHWESETKKCRDERVIRIAWMSEERNHKMTSKKTPRTKCRKCGELYPRHSTRDEGIIKRSCRKPSYRQCQSSACGDETNVEDTVKLKEQEECPRKYSPKREPMNACAVRPDARLSTSSMDTLRIKGKKCAQLCQRISNGDNEIAKTSSKPSRRRCEPATSGDETNVQDTVNLKKQEECPRKHSPKGEPTNSCVVRPEAQLSSSSKDTVTMKGKKCAQLCERKSKGDNEIAKSSMKPSRRQCEPATSGDETNVQDTDKLKEEECPGKYSPKREPMNACADRRDAHLNTSSMDTLRITGMKCAELCQRMSNGDNEIAKSSSKPSRTRCEPATSGDETNVQDTDKFKEQEECPRKYSPKGEPTNSCAVHPEARLSSSSKDTLIMKGKKCAQLCQRKSKGDNEIAKSSSKPSRRRCEPATSGDETNVQDTDKLKEKEECRGKYSPKRKPMNDCACRPDARLSTSSMDTPKMKYREFCTRNSKRDREATKNVCCKASHWLCQSTTSGDEMNVKNTVELKDEDECPRKYSPKELTCSCALGRETRLSTSSTGTLIMKGRECRQVCQRKSMRESDKRKSFCRKSYDRCQCAASDDETNIEDIVNLKEQEECSRKCSPTREPANSCAVRQRLSISSMDTPRIKGRKRGQLCPRDSTRDNHIIKGSSCFPSNRGFENETCGDDTSVEDNLKLKEDNVKFVDRPKVAKPLSDLMKIRPQVIRNHRVFFVPRISEKRRISSKKRVKWNRPFGSATLGDRIQWKGRPLRKPPCRIKRRHQGYSSSDSSEDLINDDRPVSPDYGYRNRISWRSGSCGRCGRRRSREMSMFDEDGCTCPASDESGPSRSRRSSSRIVKSRRRKNSSRPKLGSSRTTTRSTPKRRRSAGATRPSREERSSTRRHVDLRGSSRESSGLLSSARSERCVLDISEAKLICRSRESERETLRPCVEYGSEVDEIIWDRSPKVICICNNGRSKCHARSTLGGRRDLQTEESYEVSSSILRDSVASIVSRAGSSRGSEYETPEEEEREDVEAGEEERLSLRDDPRNTRYQSRMSQRHYQTDGMRTSRNGRSEYRDSRSTRTHTLADSSNSRKDSYVQGRQYQRDTVREPRSSRPGSFIESRPSRRDTVRESRVSYGDNLRDSQRSGRGRESRRSHPDDMLETDSVRIESLNIERQYNEGNEADAKWYLSWTNQPVDRSEQDLYPAPPEMAGKFDSLMSQLSSALSGVSGSSFTCGPSFPLQSTISNASVPRSLSIPVPQNNSANERATESCSGRTSCRGGSILGGECVPRAGSSRISIFPTERRRESCFDSLGRLTCGSSCPTRSFTDSLATGNRTCPPTSSCSRFRNILQELRDSLLNAGAPTGHPEYSPPVAPYPYTQPFSAPQIPQGAPFAPTLQPSYWQSPNVWPPCGPAAAYAPSLRPSLESLGRGGHGGSPMSSLESLQELENLQARADSASQQPMRYSCCNVGACDQAFRSYCTPNNLGGLPFPQNINYGAPPPQQNPRVNSGRSALQYPISPSYPGVSTASQCQLGSGLADISRCPIPAQCTSSVQRIPQPTLAPSLHGGPQLESELERRVSSSCPPQSPQAGLELPPTPPPASVVAGQVTPGTNLPQPTTASQRGSLVRDVRQGGLLKWPTVPPIMEGSSSSLITEECAPSANICDASICSTLPTPTCSGQFSCVGNRDFLGRDNIGPLRPSRPTTQGTNIWFDQRLTEEGRNQYGFPSAPPCGGVRPEKER